MPLTVFTNERYFYPDNLAPDERHLGTRDRFDVTKQYDYPGKAVGCLKAARMLQHRTLPKSLLTIWGPLVDGQRKGVAPMCWVSSNRMPDLKELERGHDAQYLSNLTECVLRSKALANAGKAPFISDFGKEADVTPGTMDAARLAVGAAYDAIDELLYSSRGDTAFVLVWPPGQQMELPLMLFFECPLAELQRRILGRAPFSGRSDDNVESTKLRFETFKAETLPIVKHFKQQGKCSEIDTSLNRQAVYELVRQQLAGKSDADIVNRHLCERAEILRGLRPYPKLVS